MKRPERVQVTESHLRRWVTGFRFVPGKSCVCNWMTVALAWRVPKIWAADRILRFKRTWHLEPVTCTKTSRLARVCLLELEVERA